MAPLSRIGTPLCLALIAGFLIVLTGCGETGSRTVDQIRVVDGAEQCALPGKAFARPVKIELLGPQEPGLLCRSHSTPHMQSAPRRAAAPPRGAPPAFTYSGWRPPR